MRILYIHQYYKTPEEGGAIRSWYISAALAKAGHEVEMLTSHNNAGYLKKQIEGVKVHYLSVFYDNKLSSLERSRAFLRFLRMARSLIDKLTPFDLCFASSTPLTIGLLALYARKRYKIPFIFEVRDLWPEAPIQLGYIRNPALKTSLQKLEKHIYAKALKVIALSPGIAKGIEALSQGTEVHIIPNMADCTFFKPQPKSKAFARVYGLEDYFVISYFGAAGEANQLEYLLHAAQSVQHQELNVKFLVAAKGGKLEEIKEKANLNHIRNIIFVPFGSKQQVQNWLSITDAVYTSFASYPVLQTNSPNKFFDGLAAGKLAIVNTRGWLQELVEENNCGFYANPLHPDEFIAKLKPYLESPSLLDEHQQNARKLALRQFSKDLLLEKLLNIISST